MESTFMRTNGIAGAVALFALGCVWSAQAADGEAIYRQTCAACHDAGVAGAPKLGDAAAWQERRGKGVDAMLGLARCRRGAAMRQLPTPSCARRSNSCSGSCPDAE